MNPDRPTTNETDRADGDAGAAHGDTDPVAAVDDDDVIGLPGLRTWTAVYLFVVAIFVAYVVLLTALSRAFA